MKFAISNRFLCFHLFMCSYFKNSVVGFAPFNKIYTRTIKHDFSIKSRKNNDYSGRSISPLYIPKTENQINYVKLLKDPTNKIILGVGDAGTGKTLFACVQAIKEIQSGNVEKIILTRPVVPVEEDLGFLPGNIIQKMAPWTLPIFDIFLEYYSKNDLEGLVRSGIIEISPLAYMRGRTFKRAFIIADEMQNSSPNQMLMLATRIGDKSRMVITGDLKQTDKGINNGLNDLMIKVRNYDNVIVDVKDENMVSLSPSIKIVEFNTTDVQRSEIVSKILDIYDGTYNSLKSSPLLEEKKSGIFSGTIAAFINNNHNNDAALIPKNHYDCLKNRNTDL